MKKAHLALADNADHALNSLKCENQSKAHYIVICIAHVEWSLRMVRIARNNDTRND